MFSPFIYLRRLARKSGPSRLSSAEASTNPESIAGAIRCSWKPVTLRAPLLLSLAAFTISLIIVLEYLSNISQRDGGIVFAANNFSTSATLTFLYLPTLVATSYSILWSWVDLDAKRLEPYFQMSRAEGAQPKSSLLLHYPFDFVAFVPYRALKRRHWSVFFAGTATMTIFWAITPLTSSIFATAKITRMSSATAVTTRSLLPLESQYSALTAGFLMTAYGIVWLEQALPAFTAYEGALVPFDIRSEQHEHEQLLNTTFTSTTTMYKTTLGCQSAITANSTTGVGYSNGEGCVVPDFGFPTTSDPTALYIGWYMNNYIDYALSGLGCSSESFSHTFLAYYSVGINNITMFCEPSYWTQQVNATINAVDKTISAIMPIGDLEPLPQTAFNVSNFEYILGTGSGVDSQRADISDTTTLVYQGGLLQDIHITGDSTRGNAIGYAFGLTKLNPSAYLNPTTLATSFEKAHQLLFALAIGTLLSSNSSSPDRRWGSVRRPTNTILVVRTLALLVESFLGLVTILTGALLCISWVRPSQLRHDPACLDDVMRMIESDTPTPMIDEATMGKNQVLNANLMNGKLRFRIPDRQQISRQESSGGFSEPSSVQLSKTKTLARPLEMRLPVAVVFVTILLMSVTVLVILHTRVLDNIGIPQPSSKTVVNQLLTNYLPVAFSTFLEPFWLLLNRVLCIFRPFEELRAGSASPSKSLKLKYTSLPPQLVIFRAVRAQHFLLAAVCAIGLSANILSVAFSGLFQTSVTLIATNGTFKPRYSPLFQRITRLRGSGPKAQDPSPLYIAKANISDGALLPPWLSQDKFFMPFDTNMSSLNSSASAVKAVTQAFGAKLACSAIEYDSIAYIKNNAGDETGYNPAQIVVPEELSKGESVICNNTDLGPFGGQNRTKAALEVMSPLTAADETTSDLCATLLLVGFLRANLTVSVDNLWTDYSDQPVDWNPTILAINSLSSMWMVCQPTFLAAPYTITVDGSGRILDHGQAGPYASNPEPFFSGNATVGSLFHETGYLWGEAANTKAYWHNDTFVDTWFAYLVKHLGNSNVFIDPLQPVPSFDAIAPVVEEIYARVFAIILSLNTQWLGDPPLDAILDGQSLTAQNRIFLSQPAYIVIMTLLGLNIIVAVAYYAKRPKMILRRMPTTIASILELFNGSGLVKEASDEGELKEEWKVGYGRFMGTDGKPRVGIDRRPFLVPWGNGP